MTGRVAKGRRSCRVLKGQPYQVGSDQFLIILERKTLDAPHGHVAQIERQEEKGRGWAGGIHEFVDLRKFSRCCGRDGRIPQFGQNAFTSSPTEIGFKSALQFHGAFFLAVNHILS